MHASSGHGDLANPPAVSRANSAAADRRMTQIRAALDVLSSPEGVKAERCQQVFSLPYEDGWAAP